MIGKVEKVEGEYAKVSILRQEMCGDCHACEMLGEVKKCEIKCHNTCQSKEGDTVEVVVKESRFLKASYLMYGLPLMGLLVGLGVGALLPLESEGVVKDGLMIALGLLGTGVMLWWVKGRERKQKYEDFLPQVTRIIIEEECGN